MGYESKIYVVEKSRHAEKYGKSWGDVVAIFDLCKYYDLSDVLRHKPETDCYIIADDGNTEIITDKYGDTLKETDLKTVIKIMEKSLTEGKNYRRIAPTLMALKVFEEQKNNGVWDDLVVLHYGY